MLQGQYVEAAGRRAERALLLHVRQNFLSGRLDAHDVLEEGIARLTINRWLVNQLTIC